MDIAAQIQSLPPSTLQERYQTLLQLGVGGMALVHLAVDRTSAQTGDFVVVKSIRPDLVDDERIITMFLDEARICVQLDHPNVVQTRDVLKVNSLPVIVMEYLDGQSFLECISAGLPIPIRLHMIVEILSGLDYAHSLRGPDDEPLGIIHRDMSPQNVIATYDGRVKLLDFGIAKAAGQATRTETGEIKGKLRYMAPEQMVATGTIDRRADIFAVGIMLWETLARRRLWDGVSDIEVVQTILESGVPAPSTFASGIPQALECVCMKAVAEDPNRRYASALAMQEALADAMESLGYSATSADLASWLEWRFADRRARMRGLIRSKLRESQARELEAGKDPGLATLPTLEMPLRGGRTVPTPVAAVAAPRSSRAHIYALGGATLFALAGIGFAMRPIGSSAFLHSKAIASGNAERNAPSPATSRSTPIGASPPATPANANPVAAPELEAPSAIPSVADVEVALSAKPHNARIFLDGAEVKNPYVAKHRADGGSHSVRAEARGYLAKTVTVVFAQDSVRLGIVLELASVPGARARKYSAPTAASPPDPAPPPSAQPRCDFPFAVDSDGIKHVRPECMP